MAHNFRPVTLEQDGRFPAWIQQLAGKHGVYIIKDRTTAQILYIGESHTGKLKRTLVRHFQRWQSNTNKTYRRERVVVATELRRTPEAAVARQYELIAALKPRDNEAGLPLHYDYADKRDRRTWWERTRDSVKASLLSENLRDLVPF